MPDGGQAMPGRFEADLAALERHEQELRLLLDKMPAAAAGASDHWDAKVFGIIGAPLATIFNIWTDDAQRFVGEAKAAGDRMADRLGEMRQTYEHADSNAANVFHNIRKSLDARTAPAAEGEADNA